jgi:hypothetical protein
VISGGDLVGHGGERYCAEQGTVVLAARSPPHPDLAPDPHLPADTRLWAALQEESGGIWRGCVYDVEGITHVLYLDCVQRRRSLPGASITFASSP